MPSTEDRVAETLARGAARPGTGGVTSTRSVGPGRGPGEPQLQKLRLAGEFECCHLIQKREQDSSARETLRSHPDQEPCVCCAAPSAPGPPGPAPASWEPGQGRTRTQTLWAPVLWNPRESHTSYEAATTSACRGLALTGTFSGIFSGRGSEGTSGSSICS